MALPRIVFHCADRDVFDLFLRGLPRNVLTEPLRNDATLLKKYFRGYRISKDRPDLQSISTAYYDEINSKRNEKLLNYLCSKWVLSHEQLARDAFASLGISDTDPKSPESWLRPAIDSMESKGHLEAAAHITRALAFDYPIEDIQIAISVLSIHYDEQAHLRQHIENEFRTVHDNPHALHEALTLQHHRLSAALVQLGGNVAAETTLFDADTRSLNNELTKLTKKSAKLDTDWHANTHRLAQRRNELADAKEKHDAVQADIADLKIKRSKMQAHVKKTQHELQQRKYSFEARTSDLIHQKKTIESDISELAARLAAAAERMAQSAASQSYVDASTTATTTSPSTVALTCNTQEVLDLVDQQGFNATPATLDIFKLKLQGKLTYAADESSPPDGNADALSYASAATYGTPPWSPEILTRYALVASLHETTGSQDERIELVLGGLFHADRVVDPTNTERLLCRLVELLDDTLLTSTNELDLVATFDTIDLEPTDSKTTRLLGTIQTKLATANARAFRRLYDAMPTTTRIRAKRALLTRIRNLGLQDTDPTHEVLDLVTTHLETLLGPLTSGLHTWGSHVSLQADVPQTRQPLLAATAKLVHVFSPATNARLTQFRNLLGPNLKAALAQDTLDGYHAYRNLLLEYCLHECRQPEWISSRYLFPIVVSLLHVASRADHRVRERKAHIDLSLEKQQHPIGTPRRRLPLRIRVDNTGSATATDIHLEIEADNADVSLQPRLQRIDKISPNRHSWISASMDIARPISATELSCLVQWNDQNRKQQVRTHTLKVIAQREVNWAQARVNPYSLRSITSQGRLVGRDDDLQALRIGIAGTQSFCVTGQKRVGKTSVARVLLHEFQGKDDYISVYLTFGDLVAHSWPQLIHSLYEAISDEISAIEGATPPTLPDCDEFLDNQSRHNRAFLRSLRSALSDRRVLCIIDDFDEIDERLYKGHDAKELFLRLRTLIDRGDFSFLFVGSEKLPDVMRHQGERLNQVQQRSLSYLRDKAALRRLVVEPASSYLEYSDDAVDVISRYSAGNPYYATQICARVYEDMLSRRDHYVVGADVARSVDAICYDSSVNNFQHFWTDGVFESGLDTTRVQYLNAAVQTACARGCAANDDSVEQSALLSDASLKIYDPGQVRFRIDNLVDRNVLVQMGDRLRLRVPLFEKWLLAGGEAAVRSSFSEEDLERRLTPATIGPSPRDVVEIVHGLDYQGVQLSEDRVRTWLEQFGPGRNQDLAFRLLMRLKKTGYFSDASVYARSRSLHRMIMEAFANEDEFAKVVERKRVTNVFISYLDGSGRSGERILGIYRNANSWPTPLVGSMEDAMKFTRERGTKGKDCAVVFVDDFIGSGASCVEGLQRFAGALETEKRNTNRVLVGVAAVVGFRHGLAAIRSDDSLDCHVVTAEELGPDDRAFAPSAGIFESDGDRVAAERLCRSIGTILEPKQPLGYSDCEALVCFSHRCPNNTLPVFYKSGVVYQGREWIPLFPR